MCPLDLSGIHPPIPIPFNEEAELALDRLRENLARWCATELAGFVVLGSNGETVHLTEKEKRGMLQTAREVIPSDRLLIAGTGEQSTLATIELTCQAADLGADAALVTPPHYYRPRMDIAALERHYSALADASPILLYNIPSYTGIDLTVEQILRLAQHPNIVALRTAPATCPRWGRSSAVRRRVSRCWLVRPASSIRPWFWALWAASVPWPTSRRRSAASWLTWSERAITRLLGSCNCGSSPLTQRSPPALASPASSKPLIGWATTADQRAPPWDP